MKRAMALVLAAGLAMTTGGCGKSVYLVVEPQKHQDPRLVKTKGLDHSQYKTLIVLRPEHLANVVVAGAAATPQDQEREKERKVLVSYIEKNLIGQGFTLISDDVLIREKERLWTKVLEAYKGYRENSGTGGAEIDRPNWTPAEYALLLGKSTGSDAIVKINRLDWKEDDLFFLKVKDKFYEMADRAELDSEIQKLAKKKKLPFKDYCELRYPNRVFYVDMEILDVHTGTILAKGDATLTTQNVLPEPFTAEYKVNGCEEGDTSFSFGKYTSYKVFEAQIFQLLDLMFAKVSE